MPNLSIITINYNNRVGLEKTIKSVTSQTYNNYEYIVIDGGSTDGSLEVIQNNKNQLFYWVSEKDKGIYNAMNKGIVKANGNYLLFLNSGDYLQNSSILFDVFNQALSEDIVFGNMKFDGGEMKINSPLINLNTFIGDSIPHGASFIKKELFKKYGLYNENNKIVSDWEFFLLALIKNKCSYRHIDKLLTIYQKNGISTNSEFMKIHNQERMEVFNQLFPEFVETINKLNKVVDELEYYKSSRIIQWIKKNQNSKIYKWKTRFFLKRMNFFCFW